MNGELANVGPSQPLVLRQWAHPDPMRITPGDDLCEVGCPLRDRKVTGIACGHPAGQGPNHQVPPHREWGALPPEDSVVRTEE